ncbi:MAG: hypothetical protein AAFZ65_06300 [Planctomycetota bacterium]
MDIRPEQPEFRRADRSRTRGAQPAETRQAESAGRGAELRALNARIEGAEADRIDLSEGARAAESLTDAGTSPDRLASLRELYQSGTLNSPERLQAAAARILGQRADS